MASLLDNPTVSGLIIGLATFLIIGLFHPLVIKGEYYFGQKCNWAFLIGGIAALVSCFFVHSVMAAALLGVTGFSCFWSIGEVREQKKRVERGWFPMNPRRRDRYGTSSDKERRNNG